MDTNENVQLLRFKIENFRSFGREQEILFSDDGRKTRKITAIVGLNATGKSNIFRALLVLQNMVKSSANAGFVLPYDYFRFTRGYDEKPTGFELQFQIGNLTYSSIAYTIIAKELFLKETIIPLTQALLILVLIMLFCLGLARILY